MKDIIYQLEAVKTKCLFEDMKFDADVLDGCIRRLREIENKYNDAVSWLTKKDIQIKKLKDEIAYTKRERDAAVADFTEFAKFYRRRTICDFCRHDSEEECDSHSYDNKFINDCFEWRGL
jgi:hypothetical protein